MQFLLFLTNKVKVEDVGNDLDSSSLIDEIASDIQGLQNQLKTRQETGRIKAFINADRFKTTLDAIDRDLKAAISRFQLLLQVKTENDITSLRNEFKAFMEQSASTVTVSESSKDGQVNVEWEGYDIDAKENIEAPAMGKNVTHTVRNTKWKTDGAINLAITAGY